MKKLLRESIPGIIAAVVVAVLFAVFPSVRSLVWSILSIDFVFSLGLLLALALSCFVFGNLVTYLVLKKTIDTGKTDVMTETLRAGEINSLLSKRIKEAKQQESSFAALLVDIDNFKRVNDEFDHETGNHTLRELADIIRPRSKGEEIFRYGGDEFLIVTNSGVDVIGCWGFANRIIREVAAHQFLGDVESDQRLKLTVSCGCHVSNADDKVVEIRKHFVLALKNAKKQRKIDPESNGVVCLSNVKNSQVPERET